MGENQELVHLNNKGRFKIAFKDLKYTVKSKVPFIKQGTKTILNRISGEFHSNELTAIIGLSGSGKSSLLDCLSGFRVNNISGTITYNDDTISTSKIREVSSYFMQEQMLHIFLTVSESMNFAFNIKCQQKLSKEEKETRIVGILKKLDISDRHNALIRDLSGGEKKRLQIAIELVDDPKILFLDECTTGLDIVSSTQCIKFLKDLTKEGRMIIFTIHQPSATMLPMFDHIYALSAGNCIYQGTSENLLTFLDEIGLPCPLTYNPIDYLMEIANNEYGDHSQLLIEQSQNGSNLDYAKDNDKNYTIDIFKKPSDYEDHSVSFFIQVYYLMMRIFLRTFRNRSSLYSRFGTHILTGLVLGYVYNEVGNDASHSINNIRFNAGSVSLIYFTSFHSQYITFPLEFPIIKREHFNGWYSSIAYYTSFILADVPIIFFCVTIYTLIVFIMSDQPLEIHRYLLYLSFYLIFAYDAQALAIMVTSLYGELLAVIFAQLSLLPFYSLSTISLLTRDTHPFFKPFFDINFFNVAISGATTSVLGMNRTKLRCDEIYCHFVDPQKLLRDFECDIDIMHAFYILFAYFVICHVGAFVLIRYKLKFMH
ncbi:ATP-binding cassette subfamily G member 4-like [Chironomus tepperi]|uniref:ATP-binding cassette subfamily G member 4-like n=1 Tax=Chironomus tepperi TaxID=113505 RepID=UPI00391FA5DA